MFAPLLIWVDPTAENSLRHCSIVSHINLTQESEPDRRPLTLSQRREALYKATSAVVLLIMKGGLQPGFLAAQGVLSTSPRIRAIKTYTNITPPKTSNLLRLSHPVPASLR